MSGRKAKPTSSKNVPSDATPKLTGFFTRSTPSIIPKSAIAIEPQTQLHMVDLTSTHTEIQEQRFVAPTQVPPRPSSFFLSNAEKARLKADEKIQAQIELERTLARQIVESEISVTKILGGLTARKADAELNSFFLPQKYIKSSSICIEADQNMPIDLCQDNSCPMFSSMHYQPQLHCTCQHVINPCIPKSLNIIINLASPDVTQPQSQSFISPMRSNMGYAVPELLCSFSNSVEHSRFQAGGSMGGELASLLRSLWPLWVTSHSHSSKQSQLQLSKRVLSDNSKCVVEIDCHEDEGDDDVMLVDLSETCETSASASPTANAVTMTSQLALSDLMAPTDPSELLGRLNKSSAAQLQQWLRDCQKASIARRAQHSTSRSRGATSQGRRARDKYDSDDCYEDDDNDEAGSCVAVLQGAVGSGKTSAVALCCQVAADNFRLIEINTSQDRSGAAIKKMFAEASQSHGLQAGGIMLSTSHNSNNKRTKQPERKAKPKANRRGGTRRSRYVEDSDDDDNDCDVDTRAEAARLCANGTSNVILFDEADLVFEASSAAPVATATASAADLSAMTCSSTTASGEVLTHAAAPGVGDRPTGPIANDANFSTAVLRLARTSKVPIVLTTNQPLSWIGNNTAVQPLLLDFTTPTYMTSSALDTVNEQGVSLMSKLKKHVAAIACSAATDLVDPLVMEGLVNLTCQGDMRAAYNSLQLTVIGHHTEQGKIKTSLTMNNFYNWLEKKQKIDFAVFDGLLVSVSDTMRQFLTPTLCEPSATRQRQCSLLRSDSQLVLYSVVVPLVTDVSPRQVCAGQGAVISVAGAHFLQHCDCEALSRGTPWLQWEVWVGQTLCSDVQLLSDSELTAQLPETVGVGVGAVQLVSVRLPTKTSCSTGSVCNSDAYGISCAWIMIKKPKPLEIHQVTPSDSQEEDMCVTACAATQSSVAVAPARVKTRLTKGRDAAAAAEGAIVLSSDSSDDEHAFLSQQPATLTVKHTQVNKQAKPKLVSDIDKRTQSSANKQLGHDSDTAVKSLMTSRRRQRTVDDCEEEEEEVVLTEVMSDYVRPVTDSTTMEIDPVTIIDDDKPTDPVTEGVLESAGTVHDRLIAAMQVAEHSRSSMLIKHKQGNITAATSEQPVAAMQVIGDIFNCSALQPMDFFDKDSFIQVQCVAPSDEQLKNPMTRPMIAQWQAAAQSLDAMSAALDVMSCSDLLQGTCINSMPMTSQEEEDCDSEGSCWSVHDWAIRARLCEIQSTMCGHVTSACSRHITDTAEQHVHQHIACLLDEAMIQAQTQATIISRNQAFRQQLRCSERSNTPCPINQQDNCSGIDHFNNSHSINKSSSKDDEDGLFEDDNINVVLMQGRQDTAMDSSATSASAAVAVMSTSESSHHGGLWHDMFSDLFPGVGSNFLISYKRRQVLIRYVREVLCRSSRGVSNALRLHSVSAAVALDYVPLMAVMLLHESRRHKQHEQSLAQDTGETNHSQCLGFYQQRSSRSSERERGRTHAGTRATRHSRASTQPYSHMMVTGLSHEALDMLLHFGFIGNTVSVVDGVTQGPECCRACAPLPAWLS